jgi:hypothetical protein
MSGESHDELCRLNTAIPVIFGARENLPAPAFQN